jgi:hypothetical protein
MVGVVEQNLDIELVENILRDSLDGGYGADRHEYGGLDLSVRGKEAARARGSASGFDLEGKRHGALIVRQRRFLYVEAKGRPVRNFRRGSLDGWRVVARYLHAFRTTNDVNKILK